MISILQTSIKDKNNRNKFKNSEPRRKYYKFLKLNYASNALGVLPIQTLNKTRHKNYCLISGRAHSVYSKKFRIARHQIKHYFSYLTGLRGSSW